MTQPTSPDARTRYWQEQIDSWQNSDQTQQAFCKENDLNYGRFGYWLRKSRQHSGQTATVQSGFVPVVAQAQDSSLSLVLPNGLELRGIASGNLVVVEQLLSRLS